MKTTPGMPPSLDNLVDKGVIRINNQPFLLFELKGAYYLRDYGTDYGSISWVNQSYEI